MNLVQIGKHGAHGKLQSVAILLFCGRQRDDKTETVRFTTTIGQFVGGGQIRTATPFVERVPNSD